jgi:hypothetical protein
MKPRGLLAAVVCVIGQRIWLHRLLKKLRFFFFRSPGLFIVDYGVRTIFIKNIPNRTRRKGLLMYGISLSLEASANVLPTSLTYKQ